MKFKFHVFEGLKSDFLHLVFNSEDKGLLSKDLRELDRLLETDCND